MEYQELLYRLHKEPWKPPETLFVIDPGPTSGFAIFSNGELMACEQVVCDEKRGWDPIVDKMVQYNPQVVLCEEYRVYAGKVAQHSWSKVDTLRIIGAIEFACHREGYMLFKQLAATVKGFCTNNRLKEWGYYFKGQPHARDAIRHGCYWLLFNKEWANDTRLEK